MPVGAGMATRFCLVILLWANTSSAQYISNQFERIPLLRMSDYSIMALMQDSSGYIWAGTQNGLNRYDGIRFKSFKTSLTDSLAIQDGFIFDMLEGSDGDVWLGTMDEGLIQFDANQEQFITHSFSGETDSQGVRTMCYDSEGKMWIGSGDGGLYRFDKNTSSSEDFSNIIAKQDSITIFSVFEASSFPGIIWIGSDQGVHALNYRTKEARLLNVNTESGVWSPLETARVVFEDRSGLVWVGGEGGLYWYDPESQHLVSAVYIDNGIIMPVDFHLSVIAEDHRSSLWLGTRSDGVKKYNLLTKQIWSYANQLNDPKSLSDNSIRSLLIDDSNMLWVGSFAGLNKYNPYREEVTHIDSESFNGGVMEIEEDANGDIWMGTTGGLHLWDRPMDRVYRPGLSPAIQGPIYALMKGHGNKLWVGGSEHAVYEVDVATLQVNTYELPYKSLNPHVDVLTPSFENREQFWIGTKSDGLFLFDASKKEVIGHYPMNDSLSITQDQDEIWAILDLGHQGVWVGTFGGLYALNAKDHSIKHYVPNPEIIGSISSKKVNSLALDNDGVLWIGTHDQGLNRYVIGADIFSNYSTTDGLPSNNISDIQKDDEGFLWISTNNGISRLNPRTSTFINYGASYGIKNEPFFSGSVMKSRSGALLFGGSIGVNMFYPNTLPVNERAPNVVITNFAINDEPVNIAEISPGASTLKLKYDENFLFFQFASLDYVVPGNNMYEYRLLGAEEEWYRATEGAFARYPNLEPGKYEFQLRGSNNHGVWSDIQTYGAIRISPPWWATWWFRTLIFASLIALSVGFHFYRIGQLLRMERMRIRIAGDLHDDLGGKLSSIAVLSDIVQNRDNLAPTDRNRLEKVSDTARHMVREVRDIVWFIKPEHDNMDDMVIKMQNIADALLANMEYIFEADSIVRDQVLNMDVRRHFLLCYKEILNNIVKHAKASRVEIQLSKTDSELVLKVKDNGIGFREPEIHRGEGLNNLSLRVEKMNGEIDISSSVGKGTSINLKAKIMESHRTNWFLNLLPMM